MDDDECFGLLDQTRFGRVAISVGGIPAVLPVNYRAFHHSIYFRTGEGLKLDAARRRMVVSFEIDGTDGRYHVGWSVLAVGPASVVVDPDVPDEIRRQGAEPWAPGPRDHLVRIEPEFVSGRRITSSPTG